MPIYAFVMASKKSNAGSSTGSTPQIFVRRGALRRFDRLKKAAADLPVAIEWDRRTDERRTASKSVSNDTRKNERRQQPPFTWKVADFVVVDAPAKTARAPRKKRASTAGR